MSNDVGTQAIYAVVVNHEEQFSIWRNDSAPPKGWRAVGKIGTKEECLEYIKQAWTDMRPLSIRSSSASN